MYNILSSVVNKESTMERNYRVGYIITSFMFMLFSLSIVLIANVDAYAASQYSLTCASCHGMPPLDSASLIREVDTGAFKGSHQTHQPAKSDRSHVVL